ncbi:signal transducer and activator of transcription 5B isoform X2 [Bemisia tabaci]|uniref:signal transducer and activator of transcription 5B isoform X2 n=1 Tax=Bemisia tabaci TaxID=7038 RepID=UPI0008F9E0DA|nr:PREDICTED: signal transducer and activator of transcription 5B isoform X2 [Bemisia tabaci]
MALWMKAQQLQGPALHHVQALYGDSFPIEVRHFLASWIEDKMWADIDPDNPQHEQYISQFVESLIRELDEKIQTITAEDLFTTKLKLMEASSMFRQRFSHNPVSLFRILKNCLDNEMNLVKIAESQSTGQGVNANGFLGIMDPPAVEIIQELDKLRSKTTKIGECVRRVEQEQESFAIQYHEFSKVSQAVQEFQSSSENTAIATPDFENELKYQKEALERALHQKINLIGTLHADLSKKLQDTIAPLASLQSRILDEELIKWKRDQQLSGNGRKFTSNLDNIQEWCESLAEIIWFNRQHIKEAERLKSIMVRFFRPDNDELPNLEAQITQLLSSLITSTFIIEKQPPQVMKTNTRFTASVRLLVGGKLNVHMTPPTVRATIISEAQAISLLKNGKVTSGEASGEIINNIGTMEYHQATKQLSVSYRSMSLKKIKRADKKGGTESVMDEKFSLLFSSHFTVGGGKLEFQVWTLSLPVVVIVHGNQEPHAWATVTWDNAFAELGRIPFVVPEKVPWCQIADALNTKFCDATGRSLTEDNLHFLAEKAFRAELKEYNSLLLSWSQFCKEPLPDRSFTFWEWFYAVMKLTREHLKGPWMDGHILGFIRKKRTEEMLAQCEYGTFLLRFSDSELGGITIAAVGENKEVVMLQPFTGKDFAIRSIADRISDLSHRLVYLYPDICKDQAFGKYYTPFSENQATAGNGYVKPFLVTHVPGWGGPSGPSIGTGSYPPTPQNMFHPQSPMDNSSIITESVASYSKGIGADFDYMEFGNLPSIEEDENLEKNLFYDTYDVMNKPPPSS